MKPRIDVSPRRYAVDGYQLVTYERNGDVVVELGVPGEHIQLTHDNRLLTFSDAYPALACEIASGVHAWIRTKIAREPAREQELLAWYEDQLEVLGDPVPHGDPEPEGHYLAARFAAHCRAIEARVKSMRPTAATA